MDIENVKLEVFFEPEETCEETNKDVNFTIECINSLFKYFADAAQTGV